MHTYITRDEAVALYKKATRVIQYQSGSTTTVVFNSFDCNKEFFVQVNTYKTGRIQAFAEPMSNKVDNIFDIIMSDEYETAIRIK
jgi:hypothetical protein